MQKDFHFYAIGVLARSAGFTADEALTIAYASQYVDDSTESVPVRDKNRFFDPVRTAHLGPLAYKWEVQKRVYMPFHFIPPNPMLAAGGSYVTKPDSKFARLVLNDALNETGDPLFRLCRIGVALHTYADTWAHQNFSGRQHEENDVETIRLKENGKWKNPWMKNFYLDVLPQIGHGESGHYPDQPYLTWKYNRKNRPQVVRDNSQEFLNAAEAIHRRLSAACGKTPQDTAAAWNGIATKVANLLKFKEEDVDKRIARWQQTFQPLFGQRAFKYDKLTWRRQALQTKKPSDIDWDKMNPSKLESLAFTFKEGFWKSKWVNFHRAALRQRHLVLENLL